MSVNMCRAYDGARNEVAPHDAALFEAWCTVRVVKAWHCCLHSVCTASLPHLCACFACYGRGSQQPMPAGADGLPNGGRGGALPAPGRLDQLSYACYDIFIRRIQPVAALVRLVAGLACVGGCADPNQPR